VSFSDLTTEGTRIVWLYQFANGDTTWRYTSIKADIVKGGYTWTSAACTHGDNSQLADADQDKMTITVPLSCALAQAHLGYAPGLNTTFTLFCCDFADPEVVMRWKGIVMGANPKSLVAMDFECESIQCRGARDGLRYRAQKMCGAVLFGPGCNLDRTPFARACNATAVSGRVVTVTQASEMDDIVGGIFSGPNAGSQQDRTIIKADSDLVTLSWPIADLATWITAALPVGAPVKLYPACKRNLTDCLVKFGNVGRYRGYPQMEGRNPMDGYTNVF
jgi:hypothetical protein